MNWPLRILALAGALCLLNPETLTDLIGLAILACIHVIQVWRSRRTPPPSTTMTGEFST
jgi:UPF0716 family protein affecting phage T7 exclusion